MKETMLGIIDAQRGFMPAAEGERLDKAGFGQLPVQDGEMIMGPIKNLFWVAGPDNTFSTQDDHPEVTAHFSDNPDFDTNWPVHCVAGTRGAQLHPDLETAFNANQGMSVTRFYKGQECLQDGKEDLSYSGYYGKTASGLTLPKWLVDRGTERAILTGLAFEKCVGMTALDLHVKLGIETFVVEEATRAITPEGAAIMKKKFDEVGIQIITENEAIELLKEGA